MPWEEAKRPENSDASDTRERLLRAGRTLFARGGYDGTSVRALAERAGVSLGAVSYHFGSKAGLYEAVAERVVSPLRAAATRAATSDGTPLERIGRIVRAFFMHLQDHPEMPQLILQRLAAGQAIPHPVAVTIQHVLGTLVALIRDGQTDGSIRAGDPVLLALSVIAQPLHLTLAGGAMRDLDIVDLSRSETRERVIAHAVGFAHAGLEAGRAAAAGDGAGAARSRAAEGEP